MANKRRNLIFQFLLAVAQNGLSRNKLEELIDLLINIGIDVSDYWVSKKIFTDILDYHSEDLLGINLRDYLPKSQRVEVFFRDSEEVSPLLSDDSDWEIAKRISCSG